MKHSLFAFALAVLIGAALSGCTLFEGPSSDTARKVYEDSAITWHGAQVVAINLCDPSNDPLPTCTVLATKIKAVDKGATTAFDEALPFAVDGTAGGVAASLLRIPGDTATYSDIVAKLKGGVDNLPPLSLQQKARVLAATASSGAQVYADLKAAHDAGPPDDARLQAAHDLVTAGDGAIQAWPAQ